MSYWREKASEAIAQVIAGAIAEGMDLKNLSEAQKRDLRIRIDAAYPFGIKRASSHPCQVWVDERRKAFDKLGLNKPATNATPGQLQLFDL